MKECLPSPGEPSPQLLAEAQRGLRQKELCDRFALDYKTVALVARHQKISTHEFLQQFTGWVLRDELYYPPDVTDQTARNYNYPSQDENGVQG